MECVYDLGKGCKHLKTLSSLHYNNNRPQQLFGVIFYDWINNSGKGGVSSSD